MLSDDEGKSWHGHQMIDGRDGVSYPDAIQAEDGRIYSVYDHNRQTDQEILMAVFTEEDVAKGRWQSVGARQRVAISKGAG